MSKKEMSWEEKVKEKIEENVNKTFYQKRLFRAIKRIVKKEIEDRTHFELTGG
jgi:hypothetical protein